MQNFPAWIVRIAKPLCRGALGRSKSFSFCQFFGKHFQLLASLSSMMTGCAICLRWNSKLDVTTSTSFSCSKTGKILLRIVLSLLAAIPVWGAVTIDATTWTDAPAASSTVTTPAFSTVSGNELVLAFVSADYLSGTNTTVTAVSGGGLTWALVVRTNAQSGRAGIGRALATAPLSTAA